MAANKASYARKLHREKWRDAIDTAKCLAVLKKVEDRLITDHKQMDLAEVPALKLLVDIQFRKLAKVLPDLKAVELSGQVQTDVIVRFNPD